MDQQNSAPVAALCAGPNMSCTSVCSPSRSHTQHKGSRGSRCRGPNRCQGELKGLLLLLAIRFHSVPPGLRLETEPAEVHAAEVEVVAE